jgi:exopolyphosphatase/guanosine-5'-triphosphate,3'-diphosphate pyrophosphatase
VQHGWSRVTEQDRETVHKQLRRAPRGLMAVARRCRFGAPQVVVTSPVVLGPGRRSERRAGVTAGAVRVFPTTYWLTCSHLTAAVGRLEGEGWVSKLGAWIEETGLSAAMAAVHNRAAQERTALVEPDLRVRLMHEQPAQWQVLATSGVAGARSEEGVKCLHAHLADYLAAPVGDGAVSGDRPPGARNPVGAKVLALLLQMGVDITGWPTCRSCAERAYAAGSRFRLASLDVGTNSCRLLLSEVDGRQPPRRLAAALVSTRLGEGLEATGRLAPQAMERTLAGLGELLRQARQEDAPLQTVAVATNAVRSAGNGDSFLIWAWERLGVAVRVVSGAEEAQLSYRGALAGITGTEAAQRRAQSGGPVAVLDIGGGSTELVVGTRQGGVQWTGSAEVGAVRLMEMAAHRGITGKVAKEPDALPWMISAAVQSLRRGWGALPPVPPGMLIGVGGTITSLAAVDLRLDVYDPARVQGHELDLVRLNALTLELAAMTPAERRQVPGLQPARADIIVAGTAILLAAMQLLAIERIQVSDSDILWGMTQQFLELCRRPARRSG